MVETKEMRHACMAKWRKNKNNRKRDSAPVMNLNGQKHIEHICG